MARWDGKGPWIECVDGKRVSVLLMYKDVVMSEREEKRRRRDVGCRGR